MQPFTLAQLQAFKRAELQTHCKARDIKASGKSAALVEALKPYVTPDEHDASAMEQDADLPGPAPSEEPAQPAAAQSNTEADQTTAVEIISLTHVRAMVETAVSEAQTALQAAFHERLEGLERKLERQQERIHELERSQQHPDKPANAASVPETPGLHLTRPNGDSTALAGEDDDEEQDEEMEAEQVADSLSPLPKRSRWPNAPAPSSPRGLGDCSSPVGNASSAATVGAPTPGRSPLAGTTSMDSPAQETSDAAPGVESDLPSTSQAQTTSTSASPSPVASASLGEPFSFLQNGSVPPAPISPRQSNKVNMPLANLPHPITFNPFQLSPQQKTAQKSPVAAGHSLPSFLAPGDSAGQTSPKQRGCWSTTGPMRRARPSAAARPTATRPTVPPTPASKSSAFGHERTQGSARFADVGECSGGLFGSASSWRQWQ